MFLTEFESELGRTLVVVSIPSKRGYVPDLKKKVWVFIDGKSLNPLEAGLCS